MGGDGQAVAVCLVDEEGEVVVAELRAEHVRARGRHASAGHHLDDVHPAIGPLADSPGDVVASADLAAQRVAVAAGARDRRSRGQYRRLVGGAGTGRTAAGVLPVAVGDGDPVAVAQVADDGHPARELGPQ